MDELDVRIVHLEPMRVAYTLGFGPSPEAQAWDQLFHWIEARGLLQGISAHRFFGFNNPNPTPGSPNYGYEQWVTVDETAQPAGEVHIKEFSGGLYAVARCKGVDQIYPTWQQLVLWQEDSRYRMASNECLEECLTPQVFLAAGGPDFSELVFDLYHPIAE